MGNRLLRQSDYLRATQENDIAQLTDDNNQILIDTEQSAQAEMVGYLKQRYDTDKVFTNTTTWDSTIAYKAKNLVQYTVADWDEGTTYAVNARVKLERKIYNATTGSNIGKRPDENSSNWSYVCDDLELFYVTLPKNEWNPETSYSVGAEVWYNDKTYTAALANLNIAPPSSTAFWGTGVAYSVIAGTLPTDATKFTAGDNRNQQVVLYLMVITLYWLHYRLNPRLIPDKIKEAYDGNGPNQIGGVIGFLKAVGNGSRNFDIPELIPTTGLAVQGGSANDPNETYTKRDNFLW